MYVIYFLFLIFALILLIISSTMSSVNFVAACIGIISGILSSLATVFSVIHFYLAKHSSDISRLDERTKSS